MAKGYESKTGISQPGGAPNAKTLDRSVKTVTAPVRLGPAKVNANGPPARDRGNRS